MFRDAIIAYHYLSRNPKFAMETVNYKYDPNNINGIRVCFFRLAFRGKGLTMPVL